MIDQAKHILARARLRGLPPGPSTCSVCGPSPFAVAGNRAAVLGGNFTAYQLLADATAEHVCAGCAGLLGGRPGDVPAPLRCVSVLATTARCQDLDRTAFWAILRDPPNEPFVLSWATSKQVHHWLYAETCSRSHLRIGADAGTIDYRPARDLRLLDAVHALLYSPTGTGPLLSRSSIASGDYHPSAVAKFGATRLEALDGVVHPYRNTPLLDLVCWCAPVSAARPVEETMIDAETQGAAGLLAAIAGSSSVRSQDGKMFWAGFFRHRVERFKGLALDRFASRMMDECAVPPPLAAEVVHMVQDLRGDAEKAVVERLRNATALCISLAYELLSSRRNSQ